MLKDNEKLIKFDLLEVKTGESSGCPLVIDYPLVESGELMMFLPQENVYAGQVVENAQDISGVKITNAKEISIQFDYPLDKPAVLTFTSDTGFTLKDIYRCVHDGYAKIYAAEEDPGELPGMLNRAKSEGLYGIWGHHVSDLYFEALILTGPNSFRLAMGS